MIQKPNVSQNPVGRSTLTPAVWPALLAGGSTADGMINSRGRAFARGEGQDRDILSRLARGANKGSQRLPTSPDGLRPYATFALVNGSPPDFPAPARTPYPCLGVK